MKTGTCIACISLAFLALAGQQPQKPDLTVSRAYHDGDMNVEGVGVCSISADSVDCWNMDGVRDSALADRVRSHYLTGYNNEISLQFGVKNRFLVLRHGPNGNLQYMSPNGQYVQATNNYSPTGDALDWVRVVPGAGDTTAAVIVSLLNLPGDPPVEAPFVNGQKIALGGVQYEIGQVHPYQAPRNSGAYPNAPDQKLWAIVFGTSGAGWPSSSFQALDRDDRPIGYVDKSGKPVSGMRFLEEQQGRQPPGYFPGVQPDAKYRQATIQSQGSQVAGAFEVVTNIDPTQIAKLRLTDTKQRKVLITGFPVNPKS